MTNKVTMEKARKNLIEFLEIYYFYSFWFHVNALFPLFIFFYKIFKKENVFINFLQSIYFS